MPYVYLAVAIIAEVIGTSCLRLTDGFSRLLPVAVVTLSYGISFFFLSMTLKFLPTGIVYATWSGVGIVLIAAIAWFFQGQKLDLVAVAGMGLIIAGVLVMNLLSKSAVH